MIKNLQKLISFKTITSQKEESKKALLWVKSQVPKEIKTKMVFYNGYPSLIIGNNSPSVCLQSHIDVVFGEKEDFKAKIKEGRLYGRGAYDMKFAIACYLEILKNIDLKKHDVGVLLTSDEEVGGFNGVKKVLDEGYSPRFCFLPDGGDNWKFDKKAKGGRHIKVTAKGSPGHASRPWEGDSATHKLMDFLNDLRCFFPHSSRKSFGPTINVGNIEGGQATNQIADKAFAKIDIRFTNEKEKKEIEEKMSSLKRKYKKIETEEIVYVSFFECDIRRKNFQKFKEIAKKHKKKVSSEVSHGSSDARFFFEKGIETMLIRPKGGGSHSEKEWVDIKDLKVFLNVLTEFTKEVSKIEEK